MSFVSSLFHIVINTRNRSHNLSLRHSDLLYQYITGVVRNRKCEMIRINGTANHLHMLVLVHQSVALSDLVRDIKSSSSTWMKSKIEFMKFDFWGKEYFAASCSSIEAPAIINYIANQREHHDCVSFEDEIRRIVERNGGVWNETMLT